MPKQRLKVLVWHSKIRLLQEVYSQIWISRADFVSQLNRIVGSDRVSYCWRKIDLDLPTGLATMVRWTEEARKRQSELIRGWQPWQKSTGPATPQGKAIASRNRCPSDYFFFHGIEIRQDTKKGKKLVDELIKTLALQRLNLISAEECCQRIAALLRKDGYIEAE